MILYFIRVKDGFVRTIQDKLVKLPGVVRLEQVQVEGAPAKGERGFVTPGVDHTMLLVRTYSGAHSTATATTAEIEQILAAGKILDAIYQYEKYEIKEEHPS